MSIMIDEAVACSMLCNTGSLTKAGCRVEAGLASSCLYIDASGVWNEHCSSIGIACCLFTMWIFVISVSPFLIKSSRSISTYTVYLQTVVVASLHLPFRNHQKTSF